MNKKLLFSFFTILFSIGVYCQSPTHPAEGFNVFLENDLNLKTNETEGSIAAGGDLSINGNYQIAGNPCDDYYVNGTKVGLLIGGKVNFPNSQNCAIEKVNGGGFTTKINYVKKNWNNTYTIEVIVSHNGCGGPSCKELSHYSIEVDNSNNVSNVSWNAISGNINGNISMSLGNNDPFDGFKLDNVSGIGDGSAGSFKIRYTLNSLQDQDFLAKAGNNYTQIASFTEQEFIQVMNCYNQSSSGSVKIASNYYVKIGDGSGAYIWYYDQNNAASPIRITPSSNYNSQPSIMLQSNSNQLNVGANNNPVVQSHIIDFSGAFQQLRTNSTNISQCDNNATLTNPNGQPISNTNLPNQVKINMQYGINYLNVTGSDLNSVSVFTYNQQPSASKVLIINVDAPGTFDWKVWNQAGIGQQQAPYILYNFYNTTTLKIKGNSTIEGTVFAPFADIEKVVNQSNIEGQVIGKSLIHSGGEMHCATFTTSLPSCTTIPNDPPTTDFTVNNSAQCLDGNEFVFANNSDAGTTSPSEPVSYEWDFGDGTSSTLMEPTKTYSNPGIYTVTLTATNAHGTDSMDTQVEVYPETPADVSVSTIDDGSGYVVKEFTLENSSSYTYFEWSLTGFGNGLFVNDNTPVFQFTQAGYYELTVSVIDTNGCKYETIIPVTILSDEVTTGNNGGIESESLGDAVTKRFINRKKNSQPIELVKSEAIRFNKSNMISQMTAKSASQPMVEMFPSQLVAGDVSHITSPTDILDYTIADDVFSVDFSFDNKTKGVVLAMKTTDVVYNHTKASCDRLKGAEILTIKEVEIDGYNFLMQVLKQRNGLVEYAISFAVGSDSPQTNYQLQSNWIIQEYEAFQDVYNFQVWANSPENTQKLVQDILNNLNDHKTLVQNEEQKLPKAYVAKIDRKGLDLVLKIKNRDPKQRLELVMDAVHTETNGSSQRYTPILSEEEQEVFIQIDDFYEFDGRLNLNGETQDVFYHADGNWGLDFDSTYTTIDQFTVFNDLDREYQEDELPVYRSVALKAHSEFDYLTLYKSLLLGTLSADYTEYNFLKFTASGSGLLELGLIKSSIQEWNNQYKAMLDVGEEKQTYYVPFDYFDSSGKNSTITADDLTMIAFNFLPVEAGTNDLDLEIEEVAFTKTAPEGYSDLLSNIQNEFIAYPNPTNGVVNCLLYSDSASKATLTVHDITGKVVQTKSVMLNKGRNELNFNLNLSTGVKFFTISSDKTNFGTKKIIVQ